MKDVAGMLRSFHRAAYAALLGLGTARGRPQGLIRPEDQAASAPWARFRRLAVGVGMIAPQVYAVAGHIGGGRVLAVVVTFGYAAFLIGPAVVGFLVTQLGIHHAMVVPAVLCAGIIGLAFTMPRDDVGLAQH